MTAAMCPSPHAGSQTLPIESMPSAGSACRNSARVAHGGVGKKSSAAGGSRRCAMMAFAPLGVNGTSADVLVMVLNRWDCDTDASYGLVKCPPKCHGRLLSLEL